MLKHLVFAAMIALGATGTAATTLTFDGNICGGRACFSGANIDQTYGDVAGQLDVVFDGSVPGPGLLAGRFNTGYGDLTNVALGGNSVTAEVFLQPVGGASITLLGLDLAGFTSSETALLTILAGDGTALFSSGTITPGAGHANFAFNLSHPSGIRIRWGPNAGLVAIDNIEFSVTVPEPRVQALLLAGLSTLALATRRRALR